MKRKNILALCMTPGVSLAHWQRSGSLGRELKLYERYVQDGWNVNIITCDSKENLPVISFGLKPILLGWRIKNHLHFLNYLNIIDIIRMARIMAKSHLIKTNQSSGAWYYALAARLAKRPFLLRCGWLPGDNLSKMGKNSIYVNVYRFFERVGMQLADTIEVATEGDRAFIVKNYRIPSNKIHIFPNWIDCSLFRPDQNRNPKERTVISVGRLDQVKRFDLLIEACVIAKVAQLTLVGDGKERKELELLANNLGLNVEFMGNQPQSLIPSLLNQHAVFALTSIVEGHPKALLEAMACGMACVCTNSQGIKEIIRNRENGVLVDADPQRLASGLQLLFKDKTISESIKNNARQYVIENCDFETLYTRERDLLETIKAQLPD